MSDDDDDNINDIKSLLTSNTCSRDAGCRLKSIFRLRKPVSVARLSYVVRQPYSSRHSHSLTSYLSSIHLKKRNMKSKLNAHNY